MDLPISHRPFTSVASSYDAVFSRLRQTEDLRKRIRAVMLREWSPGGRILDLGCGTGEDLVFLAQRGYAVRGIDPSIGMLEEARMKLDRLSLHVELLCLGAEELSVLPPTSCEGILSNFAAANTVSDFSAMLSQCARILTPEGSAVLCLLSRFSLWEVVSFLLKGDFAKAFRRLHRDPVMVRVGDDEVPTYYRSLRAVRRLAAPWFDVSYVFGLSVIAPPPASKRFIARHPYLASMLFRLDRTIGKLPLMRSMGDHFVVVLKKKGGRQKIESNFS